MGRCERTTISHCAMSQQFNTVEIGLDVAQSYLTGVSKHIDPVQGDGLRISRPEAEADIYENGLVVVRGDAFSAVNNLYDESIQSLKRAGALPTEYEVPTPVVSSVSLRLCEGATPPLKCDKVVDHEVDETGYLERYAYETASGEFVTIERFLFKPGVLMVKPDLPVDEGAAVVSELLDAFSP